MTGRPVKNGTDVRPLVGNVCSRRVRGCNGRFYGAAGTRTSAGPQRASGENSTAKYAGGSQPRAERPHRDEENRATTGQGAAESRSNVTVNLTPEKRTRIHEVIVKERNAPRVSSPHFNVSVGAQVPRSVRFAAVPRTIVEIEPEWRGFKYFMIGDQKVIVDPKTMEIVAILDA